MLCFSGSYTLTGLALATLVAGAATPCPITRTNSYRYDCDRTGWVIRPDVIREVPKIKTAIDCASLCLDNIECQSFRFVKSQQECYLYRKHLDNMYTDYNNYQPGTLYERACFSTDCAVISACNDADPCKRVKIGNLYESYTYELYACTVGRTARPLGFQNGTFLYDGTLPACDAVKRCAAERNFGSFDVHFHTPSAQWVCALFDDYMGNPDPNFRNPLRYSQHVDRTRYTKQNDSVGAGYGFWIKDMTVR